MYELFHVGQLLRCKVTDSNRAGKTGRWKPKVTIQPSNVNQNLTADILKTGLVIISYRWVDHLDVAKNNKYHIGQFVSVNVPMTD